jgi:hypothetical protein
MQSTAFKDHIHGGLYDQKILIFCGFIWHRIYILMVTGMIIDQKRKPNSSEVFVKPASPIAVRYLTCLAVCAEKYCIQK